jgi:hypothetical protein
MSVLKTLGHTFFSVQFSTNNSLIDEAAEVTKSTVMIHNDDSSKVRLTLSFMIATCNILICPAC